MPTSNEFRREWIRQQPTDRLEEYLEQIVKLPSLSPMMNRYVANLERWTRAELAERRREATR